MSLYLKRVACVHWKAKWASLPDLEHIRNLMERQATGSQCPSGKSRGWAWLAKEQLKLGGCRCAVSSLRGYR